MNITTIKIEIKEQILSIKNKLDRIIELYEVLTNEENKNQEKN